MRLPAPVRILGVGSPHGDDRAGWVAVGKLQRLTSLPPEVAIGAVDGGQRLLDSLDGAGTLILIDAMCSGRPAGSVVRMEWRASDNGNNGPNAQDFDSLGGLRFGSTHDLGPAAALRLAEALGILPPVVVVFGIELATHDPGTEISAEVESALPALVDDVLAEIRGTSDARQRIAG